MRRPPHPGGGGGHPICRQTVTTVLVVTLGLTTFSLNRVASSHSGRCTRQPSRMGVVWRYGVAQTKSRAFGRRADRALPKARTHALQVPAEKTGYKPISWPSAPPARPGFAPFGPRTAPGETRRQAHSGVCDATAVPGFPVEPRSPRTARGYGWLGLAPPPLPGSSTSAACEAVGSIHPGACGPGSPLAANAAPAPRIRRAPARPATSTSVRSGRRMPSPARRPSGRSMGKSAARRRLRAGLRSGLCCAAGPRPRPGVRPA